MPSPSVGAWLRSGSCNRTSTEGGPQTGGTGERRNPGGTISRACSDSTSDSSRVEALALKVHVVHVPRDCIHNVESGAVTCSSCSLMHLSISCKWARPKAGWRWREKTLSRHAARGPGRCPPRPRAHGTPDLGTGEKEPWLGAPHRGAETREDWLSSSSSRRQSCHQCSFEAAVISQVHVHVKVLSSSGTSTSLDFACITAWKIQE